jgi:hypothetical protein
MKRRATKPKKKKRACRLELGGEHRVRRRRDGTFTEYWLEESG